MLTKRDITILADDRGGDLAVRLENRLGYKTHILYLVGQTGAGMPPLAKKKSRDWSMKYNRQPQINSCW